MRCTCEKVGLGPLGPVFGVHAAVLDGGITSHTVRTEDDDDEDDFKQIQAFYFFYLCYLILVELKKNLK